MAATIPTMSPGKSPPHCSCTSEKFIQASGRDAPHVAQEAIGRDASPGPVGAGHACHYPIFGDYNIVMLTAAAMPVLGSPVITNNQIQFTVTGTPGDNYAVDATTNLSASSWIPMFTNQSPFTFNDTNTIPQRFYRVRSVP